MSEHVEAYRNVIAEEMVGIEIYLNSKVDRIIQRTKTKRDRESIMRDLRLTFANMQKGRKVSHWAKGLQEYIRDKKNEQAAQGGTELYSLFTPNSS